MWAYFDVLAYGIILECHLHTRMDQLALIKTYLLIKLTQLFICHFLFKLFYLIICCSKLIY